MIKRGSKFLTLIDVRHKEMFRLYTDDNTEWGYNKLHLIDRGGDKMELLYVAYDKELRMTLIKRYRYPAYWVQGLRKICNLRYFHKPVNTIRQSQKTSLISRLFNL